MKKNFINKSHCQKRWNHLVLLIGLLFCSCETNERILTERIIDEYYHVYNNRQDFKQFLDFYDENIVLEDIVNGDRIVGKQNLKDFFDWTNPNFINLEKNSLVIVEKLFDGNKSVVKGYFTKFKWGDSEFEAMHFTTILVLNESGKIIRQTDWINYPSTLINYSKRENSNEWIK